MPAEGWVALKILAVRHLQDSFQFRRHPRKLLLPKGPVPGAQDVIGQQSDPMKGIGFNTVFIVLHSFRVHADEFEIAEGNKRNCLGDQGVARPGVTIPTIHQDRADMVLKQIEFHRIGPCLPDAIQQRTIAGKGTEVVGGFDLADGTQVAQLPRLIAGIYMDPAKANPLIAEIVQSQAPRMRADLYGSCGLDRILGAGIDDTGPVVFAHGKPHVAVEIVALELQPCSGFHTEIHPEATWPRDFQDGFGLPQGLQAADLSRL